MVANQLENYPFSPWLCDSNIFAVRQDKVWVSNSYKCRKARLHDSDKILSIDSFKNAFFGVRSALGKRTMIASRVVLEFTLSPYKRGISRGLGTHFFVTVIKSCVLR
jgi:hypothetical protein